MADTQRTAAPARAPSAAAPAPRSPLSALRKPLLLRKCACGGETAHGGECDACRRKSEARLQRQALAGAQASPTGTHRAPPLVHQVLRSGGAPLDGPTRAFMEPRFGRDFSRVRVHTDPLAAASARAVQAAAYTVGDHIVFGAGQQRASAEGRDLLAHELAHVSQQEASGAVPAELEVDHPSSFAEREAEQAAARVRTPVAAPFRPAVASPPIVHRRLEGAVVGAAAGALAGVGIGAIFGPIGALVGGLVGLAGGALIGHLLTRGGKKDDEKAPALDRIRKLLSTGLLDWRISQDEARQALMILLALPPLEMLRTLTQLKREQAWGKLENHLPEADQAKAIELEAKFALPDAGFITPGDVFQIDFEYGAGHDERERAMSQEYTVAAEGLKLPLLDEPVAVAGMLPRDAAGAISEAYAEAGMYENISIRLTAKRRNQEFYFTQPNGMPGIFANAASRPTKRGAAVRKRRDFLKYLDEVGGNDLHLMRARDYYLEKLKSSVDSYDSPAALWEEARAAAPPPGPIAESPLRRFLDFQGAMQRLLNGSAPEEKKKMQATMSRYVAWVSKHIEDPKLASIDPGAIWAQAFTDTLHEEQRSFEADYLRKVKGTHEKEHDEKATAKYAAAIDLLKVKILRTRDIEFVEGAEHLNDENDLVRTTYELTPSKDEIEIRNRIASLFLKEITSHMQDDDFTKTTVTDDFVRWLKAHPAEHQTLLLTESYKHVVKYDNAVEIPTWQIVVEVGVGFIPIVGQIVGAYEVISGDDMFGHPMTPTARAITAAAILLPAAAKIFKGGKALVTASTIARDYRLSPREAEAVFRATAGIAPGTRGGALLRESAEAARAGKPLSDPTKLAEMNQLLQEMGMSDSQTVAALSEHPGSVLQGVEAEAKQVAQQEIKALGAMDDASAAKLADDAPLRHALNESPLASTVLKKCASPCFPPELTADQVQFLEKELERLSKTTKYDVQQVRDFLYARRSDLNKALGDIAAAKDAKEINKLAMEAKLQEFHAADPKNEIKTLPSKEDPRLGVELRDRAYEIGERHGRAFASSERGLKGTGFVNPIQQGRYDQGFDDIMIKGSNIDKDLVYIVEYKGGSSRLKPGQMERDWVVKNIERLRREGGDIGQRWADKLETALREKRLRGLAVSTPLSAGSPQASVEIGSGWMY